VLAVYFSEGFVFRAPKRKKCISRRSTLDMYSLDNSFSVYFTQVVFTNDPSIIPCQKLAQNPVKSGYMKLTKIEIPKT
jgi:hypothetical protein